MVAYYRIWTIPTIMNPCVTLVYCSSHNRPRPRHVTLFSAFDRVANNPLFRPKDREPPKHHPTRMLNARSWIFGHMMQRSTERPTFEGVWGIVLGQLSQYSRQKPLWGNNSISFSVPKTETENNPNDSARVRDRELRKHRRGQHDYISFWPNIIVALAGEEPCLGK